MNVINWLLTGDENIKFLVEKYLLDGKPLQNNGGYIEKYLAEYNAEEKRWSGYYGPKWTSSTYTLLDLMYFEVSPTTEVTQAYDELLVALWDNYHKNPKKRTLDLCIVGMLVYIGAYLKTTKLEMNEMIDFILKTINEDGAWNCFYDYREYRTSSVHTTINILEGLGLYLRNKYTYRSDEVLASVKSGTEFLLKKKLYKSRREGTIIHKDFTEFHFPVRWKYDGIRAMEFFATNNIQYDERMDEILEIIKGKMTIKPAPRGKFYSGKSYFKFEEGRQSRINTYRALKILRKYDIDTYNKLLEKEDYV